MFNFRHPSYYAKIKKEIQFKINEKEYTIDLTDMSVVDLYNV